MELFEAYSHALASLAGWAILILVGIMVAGRYQSKSETDTGLPKRDYASQGYRAHRHQQNMLEMGGAFIAATLAAMLTGASPFWVNLLASLFLVSRIAMMVVHVWTVNQPARSACWTVGAVCVLGLGIFGVIGAFL